MSAPATFTLPAGAPSRLATLAADFAAGRKSALARVVSIVEDRRPGHDVLLTACHARIGTARRIGITGPPGAGKSTLVARLAEHYLTAGLRVGVVAVDPTSPFTGGALLGDRVRMEAVALHERAFIRSMATRGSLGGLAAATREVCDVLDAFGMERILVETVGVGQSELEIARLADSSAVVLVPESGDSIQTLKAGVMEIADLFVVNKADRPGADRLRKDIELMLGLRAEATHPEPWNPPILLTTGTTGEGIAELAAAFDRHFDHLVRSDALRSRRRERLRDRVRDAVEQQLRQRVWGDADLNAWLDAQLPALERAAVTPLDVAAQMIGRLADGPY